MSKVAEGVLGIVLIAVGAYTDNPALIAAGAEILLSEAATALAPTDQSVSVDNSQDLSGLSRNTDLWSRLIYGETRVGGVLDYLGTTGTNNDDLDYVIAHCYAHEMGVEAMTDVWLDGKLISDADIDGSGNVTGGDFAGLVEIHRYDGNSSQAVDPELEAYADWDATGIGKGVCYTHVRCLRSSDDAAFKKAFPTGAPSTIEVLIQGDKVYDPRLDSTAGGSGSQRVSDPTTWAYSQNPALCLRDYLTRTEDDGGVGWPDSVIDTTYLAAAATVCDGIVNVPDGLGGYTATQARYQVNGVLVAGTNYAQNVQAFIIAMAGALVQAGGSFRVYAGAYASPVYTLTEDEIAGPVTFALPARGDRYNYITASFRDKDNAYQTNEAQPFQDSAYETADNGRLEKHLDMPLTSGNYDAQIVMHALGVQSRYLRTFNLQTNARGLIFNVWNVVNVNLQEFGGTDIPCRVLSCQYMPDLGAKLVLREIDVSIWTWDGTAAIEPPTLAIGSDALEKPAAPTIDSAIGTSDGIELSMTPPGVGSYLQLHIYRSSSSGGTYSLVGKTMATVFRDPVTDGRTYYYKALAWNGYRDSDYSSVVSAKAEAVVTRLIQRNALTINASDPTPPTKASSSKWTDYIHFESGVTDQGAESYSLTADDRKDLSPGTYRVTIIARVNDNSADGIAGAFDSVYTPSGGGSDVVGDSLDLRWSDFQATDAWQSFSFNLVELGDDYLGGSGYTIRFNWEDNGPASGTLDILSFSVEAVNKGIIDSSAPGNRWRGSVPPTFATAFTYTCDSSSIEWSWSGLVIYNPDGSTIDVPDGSQNFTGLSSATTYYFYPYWDLTDHSVKWAGDANTAKSYTSAQTQNQYDHSPLSVGSMSAATTSSGTGGGGGGGGSACLHERELVLTRRGHVRAINIQSGDEVRTRAGWAPVLLVRHAPQRKWVEADFSNGETFCWTPEQPVKLWNEESRDAGALRLGLVLELANGELAEVRRLALVDDPAKKVILSIPAPHWFFQREGSPELHNGTGKT